MRESRILTQTGVIGGLATNGSQTQAQVVLAGTQVVQTKLVNLEVEEAMAGEVSVVLVVGTPTSRGHGDLLMGPLKLDWRILKSKAKE